MAISDHIVPVLIKASAKLPFHWLRAMGRAMGGRVANGNSKMVQITRKNIETCLPHLTKVEQQQLVVDSIKHTSMIAFEMGSIWQRSPEWMMNKIESVEGIEYFNEAIKSEQGLILICPHLGNWEVANYWVSTITPITALFAPPKSKIMNDMIKAAREKTGSKLVPTNRKGVAALLKALKQGETIGILPDQLPKEGSGVYADFMGHTSYTMTLVNTMAAKTGANMLTITALRTDTGFRIVLEPFKPKAIPENREAWVAEMNQAVAKLIMHAPEQYQWEYKRFRRLPDGTSLYN